MVFLVFLLKDLIVRNKYFSEKINSKKLSFPIIQRFDVYKFSLF